MFNGQPDMVTHLEVWLSAMLVSGVLLDLLAVFNILLDCLPYIFHYPYHSLGILTANPLVLGQGVVNGMPVKGSSGFVSIINEK